MTVTTITETDEIADAKTAADDVNASDRAVLDGREPLGGFEDQVVGKVRPDALEDLSLDELSELAKDYHGKALGHFRNGIKAAWYAGAALNAAKGFFVKDIARKNGKWGKWLRQNFPSQATAWRYMQLAEGYPTAEAVADLTITQALRALRPVPPADVAYTVDSWEDEIVRLVHRADDDQESEQESEGDESDESEEGGDKRSIEAVLAALINQHGTSPGVAGQIADALSKAWGGWDKFDADRKQAARWTEATPTT